MKKVIRIIHFLQKQMMNKEKYAKKIGVKIGINCRIATYRWGSEPYLISIGNHVHISNNVQFITHDGGVWIFRDEIPDFDVFGQIHIDDNTYIGNNAVILPGVSIGKNCVIGANSVVTKSIHDNSVVAGVPARFICSTDEYKRKLLRKNTYTKNINSNQKRKHIEQLSNESFIQKEYLK
ncbi:MAG: acyltransferase [Clostridiaceae bacterium]|nr:acyltransferase [Clostridiaceae bacterium]